MKDTDKCLDCKYSWNDPNPSQWNREMTCRFNPPVAVIVTVKDERVEGGEYQEATGIWPHVKDDDACAKFERWQEEEEPKVAKPIRVS